MDKSEAATHHVSSGAAAPGRIKRSGHDRTGGDAARRRWRRRRAISSRKLSVADRLAVAARSGATAASAAAAAAAAPQGGGCVGGRWWRARRRGEHRQTQRDREKGDRWGARAGRPTRRERLSLTKKEMAWVRGAREQFRPPPTCPIDLGSSSAPPAHHRGCARHFQKAKKVGEGGGGRAVGTGRDSRRARQRRIRERKVVVDGFGAGKWESGLD